MIIPVIIPVKTLRRTLIAAALFAQGALLGADTSSFNVATDISLVPGPGAYAASSKLLCEEWYPKINAALFGPDTPLPYKEVKITFEPAITMGTKANPILVAAYAHDNTVHINYSYVVKTAVDLPKDYAAMFIHELTHVNQHYPTSPNDSWPNHGWMVEGIADYVRHKYFEKDIEPRLHLDSNGELQGFERDRNRGTFEREGYLGGYTVAGAFLYWLEVRKDKNIVPALNRALREGRYSVDLFEQHCGAPLAALWHEFVLQSKP